MNADRFDDDRIVTGGVHGAHDIARRGGESTQAAATGHAANKDVGIAGQLHHPDTITEDGTAGEWTGRVNRYDANLCIMLAKLAYYAGDKRTFAGTGRSSHTDDMGVTGVLVQFRQVAMGERGSALDQGHHASKGAPVPA